MLLLSTTLRLTCLLVCLLAIVNQCSSKEASSNKSSVPENSLVESATLNATNPINPIETSSSTSESNDSSIDDEDEDVDKEEPKTEPKTIEKKNSKDEDNEDDEDEEGDETCDASCGGKMSEFIREYNFSQTFLPDDHEQLTETLLSSTDIYNQIHHVNDSLEVMQRFVKYVDKLSNNQDIIETMMYAFSMMMDKIYEVKLEPQCQADILQVVNGVRRRELWAMRFPDSFGKLPSGLLRGTVSSFGEYDQCISIKSPITPQLDRHIYGQYCQIQLRMFTPKIADYDPSFEDSIRAHPLWEQLMALGDVLGAQNFLTNKDMKIVKSLSQGLNALTNNMFYYGACFPSSCSAEDIERLYNRFVYPILKTPVSVLPKFCDKNPEIVVKVLDNYQWTAIICLSTLSIIVILCSLYHFYLRNFVDNTPKEPPTSKLNLIELYNNKNNLNLNTKHEITQIDNPIPKSPKRSIPQQFVLSFSAFQNTDKLMAFDNRSGVVDSIRLVLTFFVYALQAFDFTFIMTTQLIKDIFFAGPGEFLSHNAYWFSRLPGIWIDGFMFTMGMMLINTQFSKLKRSNGQFDYLLYVWKRWYRLSIAMIGTFFALYLLPLFGNGPLWYIHDQWILPACKEPSSIISSFLYFSNTNAMRGGYKVEGTIPLCNPPTWFLSMSTQLYLIAPLVFLPLYFKPRIGITITVIIILLSPISTTAPYLFYNLPSYVSVTSFESAQEGVRAFLHYHTYPFQYVTALHIGFLTGYAIKRHPNMQFIGGRVTELALWVMTFPLIVAIFVWHNSFWDFGKINSIYNTLGWFVCSKFMLPGALGYICYMCCTGRAKTMNRILTFRTLQPLAKLSYGIYLLRVPTIFYRIASPKHTYEIKYFQMWQNVFVDFLITAVMAYFLYLLFEAPAANIMRIFEQNDLRIGFIGQNKPKSDDQNNNKTKIRNQNNNLNNHNQEQVEMSNGKEKPQFSTISLSVEQ